MADTSFEQFALDNMGSDDEGMDFSAPPYPIGVNCQTQEEEPEISEALEKELLGKRIRPVFTTKRYRKVVIRNASTGEFEVAYMPKRKKTWTARSEAGFKKACKVRAQNCKERKALRVKDQIVKLQNQLQELAATTEEPEEEDVQQDDSDSSSEECVAPVSITVSAPKEISTGKGGKSIERLDMFAPKTPSKRKDGGSYIDIGKKPKKVKKND